ncbi:MAG: sigma 54-interacting transcriptional regulator [Polyangiales bacterium]
MSVEPRRPPKVLLVDDGERYVELAHALLRDYRYATRCELAGPCWTCARRPGCTLTHAHDWGETEQALSRHRDLDVVLLDMHFELPEERLVANDEAGVPTPSLSRRRALQGLAILARIRALRPALPVILMTSTEELRLRGADAAADEYVVLAGADGFDARALGLLVERVLARRDAPSFGSDYEFGVSPAMARLRRDAMTLARTSLPVLITGEPGTGKSALARQVVHAASGRAGPFVTVDVSALPEGLVGAELFGSARGAFSGAVDRAGRFEAAHGGTLLLDEIGNLSLEVQRMLLMVLQERQVTRLGEHQARPVDVKVLAATNTNLRDAVRRGRFRADLYARLNPAAGLVVPPLRERREDLPALLARTVEETFAEADAALLAAYLRAAALPPGLRATARLPGSAADTHAGQLSFAFSDRSLAALMRHAFPGNVRELRLLVSNACLLSLSDALTAADAGRAAAGEARIVPIPERLVDELLAASWVPSAPVTGPTGADVVGWPELVPRDQPRDVARDLERALYQRLFAETGGDFEAMARRLLRGEPSDNARRVQLRFNQLGLRVRE